MKIIKAVLLGLFFLVVVIIQLSFIKQLPFGLVYLELALLVLVFFLIIYGLKLTLPWIVVVGLVLDVFNFSSFGLNLICLILTFVLLNLFLINILTANSLYTYIVLVSLGIIFSILIKLFIFQLIFNSGLDNLINFNFWLSLLKSLIVNLSLTIVSFYILSSLNYKLKPAFLARRK